MKYIDNSNLTKLRIVFTWFQFLEYLFFYIRVLLLSKRVWTPLISLLGGVWKCVKVHQEKLYRAQLAQSVEDKKSFMNFSTTLKWCYTFWFVSCQIFFILTSYFFNPHSNHPACQKYLSHPCTIVTISLILTVSYIGCYWLYVLNLL